FAWARDAGEADLAVRLIAALIRYAFWRMRVEVLAWGERVVEAIPDHPRLAVAYVAAAAGSWISGRQEQGQGLARRASSAGGGAAVGAMVPPELAANCVLLAIWKRADAHSRMLAWPAKDAADVAHDDQPEILSAYREATARTAPRTAGRAIALANEALALAEGNACSAWPTAREAVAHARASGNPTAIAWARFAEGWVAANKDPAAAAAALDEARAVAVDAGCRLVSALALTATVALRGGNGPLDDASALHDDAIRLWRATGDETPPRFSCGGQGLSTLLSNLVVVL